LTVGCGEADDGVDPVQEQVDEEASALTSTRTYSYTYTAPNGFNYGTTVRGTWLNEPSGATYKAKATLTYDLGPCNYTVTLLVPKSGGGAISKVITGTLPQRSVAGDDTTAFTALATSTAAGLVDVYAETGTGCRETKTVITLQRTN
jgi:hypothetical protein